MKILLMTSTALSEDLQRFMGALRTVVGTCEHLCLVKSLPRAGQQKLLDKQRSVVKYDRYLLLYHEAADLVEHMSLCEDIEQLTLLSLQPESVRLRRTVMAFARSLPWIRWAGSDDTSFDVYQDRGIDAHLLPPMVSMIEWQLQRKATRAPMCHVFGDARAPFALELPKIADFYRAPVLRHNRSDYIIREVARGDAVLFQDEQSLERHILALIMARGGVVLKPSLIPEKKVIRDILRNACVRLDSSAEAEAVLTEIRNNAFAELVQHSLIQAQMFSPEAVARVLSHLLMQYGRSRITYRHRSNWL